MLDLTNKFLGVQERVGIELLLAENNKLKDHVLIEPPQGEHQNESNNLIYRCMMQILVANTLDTILQNTPEKRNCQELYSKRLI